MTTGPRVSILIPAARQAERLGACLASLAADGCRTPREILVLLNQATAEVRKVASRTPGITVLESAVGLGVAGGYNRLQSAARGELLALLHDDTEMEAGWLDRLVETLDAHPEAGLAGGLVLRPDGGLRSDGWILWRDPFTTPRWRTTPPAIDDLVRIEPVDYLAGSFILARASTFDAIGGLDEAIYPAYWVDVSLALAVRAHGQIALLDPRARQIHHEGTLSGEYRQFLYRLNALRLKERWAAELGRNHLPFADTDAAWTAARLRTEEVASRLTRERRWEGIAAPERPAFDPVAQERRALLAEADTRARWAAELELRLDRQGAELSALSSEVAELRRLAATRFVSLYRRLAPRLRWLLAPRR